MEDKSNSRSPRPRPYDLRRKVLLKNFLKEQMTYIPRMRMTTSLSQNDDDFSMESSDLNDLSELNDENKASIESSEDAFSQTESIEDNASISLVNMNDSVPTSNLTANFVDRSVSDSKPFKFSSLMKKRQDRKKKKMASIVKAKKKIRKDLKSPVKSRSFKSGLERLLSGRSRASNERSSENTKTSTKSLFSIFKAKKEQNRVRTTSNIDLYASNETDERTCTSNQSVQTDTSWVQEELTKVEQSNKLLKEENRLLSESLSYFMSSNSLDSRLNASPNRNIQSLRRYRGCYDNLSSCASYGYPNNDWSPRPRVMRSRSVYQPGERTPYRHPYRTRSMNIHSYRDDFTHGPMSSSTSYSLQNVSGDIRRRSVLTNLPVSNGGRIVQRRSSMPERILSENERSRMCQRSGSMRSSRTPFHLLPSEAFY